MSLSVAVVGAGASGLCAARHLRSSGRFRFRVFEMSSSIGGTWNYSDDVTWKAGGDVRPAHSSMYLNLRSDIPREVMQFPDFPMEACAATETSYVHHSQVFHYLLRYAQEYGLLDHIEFNKEVEHVTPVTVKTGGAAKWRISVSDLVMGTREECTFDSVMVCNGHFSDPRTPPLPGMESFGGVAVHSHSYRRPEPFAGRRVVVWGASSSACDIALEVATVAKSVTICHRPTPWLPSGFPSPIKFAANIVSAQKEGFQLEDGTFCQSDALIYCTGYRYSFPFLSPECKIEVDDNHVTPLYKHLINAEHPTMCLVGVPQLTATFPMVHSQVQFFLEVLQGSVALPSVDEMLAESRSDAEGRPKRKAHHLGERLWDYLRDLAGPSSTAGPSSLRLQRIMADSITSMMADVANFKKYRYELEDGGAIAKVQFFLEVLQGSVALPSVDEMLAESRADAEGRPKRKAHHLGERLWDYLRDLAGPSSAAGPSSLHLQRIMADSITSMMADVANFKKYRYELEDGGAIAKVQYFLEVLQGSVAPPSLDEMLAESRADAEVRPKRKGSTRPGRAAVFLI